MGMSRQSGSGRGGVFFRGQCCGGSVTWASGYGKRDAMAPQTFKTTCFHDCWDACGIRVTVQDGRVVRLEGDPEHPYTRGFLCGKMLHYTRWQYSRERLCHPLLKHEGTWKRIGWDEALERCAAALQDVLEAYGPLAILYELGGGSFGMLRMLGRRFFHLLGGATFTSGSLCDAAGEQAQVEAFGACLTHDPRDVLNSRCVVVWGRNVATTHLHFLPWLKAARRRGARLVVVDPLPTATARMADLWLQPRPGSDVYLALAWAQVLLKEGWVDEAFLEEHTEGWASFRDHVERFPLEMLSQRCDVPVERIREAARTYGRSRPASIWTGMGLQHYRWGREAQWCVSALGAMTGNLGIPGGGVSFDHPSASSFDKSVFLSPQPAVQRSIPKPVFGEALASLKDPPIRVAWFQCSNLVNQTQDTAGVLKALAQIPFKVALEVYMTDTARACDLVLPVSTFLEREDVRGSYGDRTVGYMARVVDPPGEARSDLEIYQALAQRLGLEEAMAGPADSWIRRLLRPLEPHGITLETLRQAGHAVSPLLPLVPFEGGTFPTASGRYRFPASLRWPEAPPQDGRLFLVTPKAKAFHNSHILEAEDPGPPRAVLHPETAAGLSEGMEADLVSSLGRMRVRVVLDPRMRRDTVRVDAGGHHGRGAGVNALVPAVLSWDGGGACYHEARVRVEPVS